MMSKKKDLVKNTLIIALGKLSTQFVAFILLPIYTIFLAPDQFGAVDLITSYITLLVPLIMIQLDRSMFRLLIEARGDYATSRIVVSNTLRIVATTAAVALLGYIIAVLFVSLPYAALIAIAVVATILSGLSLQIARGVGQNKHFAIASIITAIVNLGTSLLLVVVLGMGVEGVLWSMITSAFAATLYIFTASRLYRLISFSPKYSNPAIRKELLSFAWPLVPSAVSWWFIKTFDRTLVAIILGIAANGIYAAANRYALILNVLYLIFDMSWTEAASVHINSKDRDKFFSDVYNMSFRLFGALGLMMIAVTPFAFNILIGEDFQEAYWYIPILVVGALFNAAVSQYSVVYIAKKKTKEVLVTSITAAVVSVALNIVLIPLIGLWGAALSFALTFLIMAIWRHFDIKKYVDVTFTGHIFLKLLASYVGVMTLYYMDGTYTNIAGLMLAVIASLGLSRQFLKGGLRGLKMRFTK